MNLHSERNMLQKALHGNYAVGAFNFGNVETLRAIIDAANEEKSPVILSVSESGLKLVTPSYMRQLFGAVLMDSSVPVSIHLDHGKSIEMVKEVLDLGFNSVMIDGSSLPFQKNIELTQRVVELANRYDASVEGELGVLAGVEDNVKVSKRDANYTDPFDAKVFVQTTGVDSLAIAIGTSHGAFKFSGDAQLRFDILSEIEKLLHNFPIVLHGASNVPAHIVEMINNNGGKISGAKGVPEDMLKFACQTTSVCKVNCDTDVRMAYTAKVREYLNQFPEKYSPRDYLVPAREYVKQEVARKMREILMSSGKAE